MRTNDYRRLSIAVLLAIGLSGCASAPPAPPQPTPIPTPVPTPPAPPASHVEAVTVRGSDGQAPQGLIGTLIFDDGTPTALGAVLDGRLVFVVPPTAHLFWGAWVHISAPTYAPFDVRVYIHDKDGELLKDCGCGVEVHLASEHVDPSLIPLSELAQIGGSMWTARMSLPYGPRPNQDSNIIPFVFYDLYDAATRARMIEAYKARPNYNTTVTGPVTGNDCYHGLYPCKAWHLPNQAEWDAYLDSLQEQWDAHLTPCYFARPDDGAQGSALMDALDALYRQPRAQKLIRCVVYPGWEPSGDKYGWPNSAYVYWVKRGAEVFPNALRVLHTVSDLDAPTGQNDDQTFPPNQGNAISWRNVAPYIHVWFDQLGGYIDGKAEVPSATFLDELRKHVDRVRRGFHDGAGGWPTSSAWGANRPLLHCIAEDAAYGDFWWNWAEKYSIQIGDAAMAAGADCFLDGGSVPVPAR